MNAGEVSMVEVKKESCENGSCSSPIDQIFDSHTSDY